MVEVARFFDVILYGESDQAEVQSRFRPTGVLYEAGSRLAVSAPGGMFVSVADGEAMVEGFHYKNTTAKPLAVASNTSGATRYDRIVLRLDRVANSLSAVIKQGTPGSGAYAALTMIAGGVWELPLGGVAVTNGALSIVASNLIDHRTFGSMLHNSVEVGLAAAQGTFAGVQRRILTTDASGNLYFDENAPGRHNFLHNSGFKVNQRGVTIVSNVGEFPVDRWVFSVINNVSGYYMGYAYIGNSLGSNLGAEGGNAIFVSRTGATALPVDGLAGTIQTIEATEAVHLYGMPMVLSFWVNATKAGVYGANIEQVGSNWKYVATFTVNAGSTWEYKTIQIPWSNSGTWVTGTPAGSMVVRFVMAAGANQRAATSNAWINAPVYAASAITNPATAISDTLYISEPKLEVGTLATRWEPEDYATELMKAYRHLYVEQPSGMVALVVHGVNSFIASVALPVHMRASPSFTPTPTPTYQPSGGPTGAQFSILAAGAFVTGLTYSTWVAWLPSTRFYSSLFTSSTNATSVASGQAGILTLGNGLKLVYSAEL
jgi:hypothetical protein